MMNSTSCWTRPSLDGTRCSLSPAWSRCRTCSPKGVMTMAEAEDMAGTPAPGQIHALGSGMTPRERVLAVLQRREPDRVPHFEWVHDRHVIAAITGGGTYDDLIEQLDIDGVMVGPAYRRQPLGEGRFRDEWGSTRVIGHDDYALAVEELAPLKTD